MFFTQNNKLFLRSSILGGFVSETNMAAVTVRLTQRVTNAIASWIHSYSDNVMTKFMINNRTDALKTDINLLNRQRYSSSQWSKCCGLQQILTTVVTNIVVHLTNRFHVAVRLFSNRSQMTSKCGKNTITEQTHGYMESICFI